MLLRVCLDLKTLPKANNLQNLLKLDDIEKSSVPQFIVMDKEEAKKRIDKARQAVKNGEYIEEKQFWEEIEEGNNKRFDSLEGNDKG